MTRWHLLRAGRITRSTPAPDGDTATAALGPTQSELVISDADWWAMQHRRALRGVIPNWNPFRAQTEALASRRALPRLPL